MKTLAKVCLFASVVLASVVSHAQCNGVLPDWAFTAGTMTPATISTDGTVRIEYSVRNGGCQLGRDLPSVGVFLTDLDLNALQFFGRIPVSGQGGNDVTFSLPFENVDIAAGRYLIALMVDVDREITESNENNNVGTFNLNVVNTLDASSFDANSPVVYQSFIDTTPNNAEVATEVLDASAMFLEQSVIIK